jgi:hypothetical protein
MYINEHHEDNCKHIITDDDDSPGIWRSKESPCAARVVKGDQKGHHAHRDHICSRVRSPGMGGK